MKKIVSLVVVLILILNVSCDKCEEGDRATPASFFVAIVDATTDENVFENETFPHVQTNTIQDTCMRLSVVNDHIVTVH